MPKFPWQCTECKGEVSKYSQSWPSSCLPKGKSGKKSVLTDAYLLNPAELSCQVPSQKHSKEENSAPWEDVDCTLEFAKDALMLGNRFVLENSYNTQDDVTHFSTYPSFYHQTDFYSPLLQVCVEPTSEVLMLYKPFSFLSAIRMILEVSSRLVDSVILYLYSISVGQQELNCYFETVDYVKHSSELIHRASWKWRISKMCLLARKY